MVHSFIACKSDPAELPKSWFSVKNITEKSWSCQLDLGCFLGIFCLFVFRIINWTRPRMWKRLWRPPQTSNHWKSTLTSCRSVDWSNFQTIKLRDFLVIITSENQLFSSCVESDLQAINLTWWSVVEDATNLMSATLYCNSPLTSVKKSQKNAENSQKLVPGWARLRMLPIGWRQIFWFPLKLAFLTSEAYWLLPVGSYL